MLNHAIHRVGFLVTFYHCAKPVGTGWQRTLCPFFLFVLGAWLTASSLYAQGTTPRFEHLTTELELPHNTVYAILQDQKGFMWLGTEDGLVKYDGSRMTLYKHDPRDSTSLPDSWVTAIQEDQSGTLWVGTRYGGLAALDRKTDRFTRYPYDTSDPKEGLKSHNVRVLHEDNSGTLWIGTQKGLSKIDRASGTFTHYEHDPSDPHSLSSNNVYCLFEDRTGMLWIGTWAEGLNAFDQATNAFAQYRRVPSARSSLSSNRIRAIYEDRNGILWIGTSGGGLNRWDRQTGEITVYKNIPGDPHSLSDNKVWAIHEDRSGILWVGTFDGGLNRFDPHRNRFQRFLPDASDPNSLTSDIINTIYEDRSGILWLGSAHGVQKYNLANERFAHYTHDPTNPNSLNHPNVLALYVAPDWPETLWIGTNGGGLNRFEGTQGRITTHTHDPSNPNSLSHNAVSSIVADTSGAFWIGTIGGGLNKLDPISGRVTRYQHDPADSTSLSQDAVYALYVDRSGTLWVGTDGGGLNRFDAANGTFIRYLHDPQDTTSLSNISVETIYEDLQGTLWVGTFSGGLNKLDRATGRFTRYQPDPNAPHSLSHDRVVSIYEDPPGTLWIGTYGGLNKFDRATQRFTLYTEQDGLLRNTIYGVVGDEAGRLWISTSNGLTRFDPQTEAFTNYDATSGLPGIQFSPGAFAKNGDGALVFGGLNGFTTFQPENLPDASYKPPIVITSFEKQDEVVATDLDSEERIELSYKDGLFSFEFALLDYAAPTTHQYQYLLEGFEETWHDANGLNGRATYVNLEERGGTFRFIVRGFRGRGDWSETSILVRITPPWWRTTWFQASILFGVLFLGTTFGLYWYRAKRDEQAETQRMLSESREQERLYLTREIHDVPLQNLYSVRHKLELVSRTPDAESNAPTLQEAQALLDQTAEDLRRICGELRPPTLGPFGLEKAILAHVRTFERVHPNLEITTDLVPDAQALPEQLRLALFRIYQGALSNVARHAQARHVEITLALDNAHVTLAIRDDGRGFTIPKSWLLLARQQHYGLLGIAEWAEAAGGHLTVQSAPGQGTLVHVVVPRSHRHPPSLLKRIMDRCSKLLPFKRKT